MPDEYVTDTTHEWGLLVSPKTINPVYDSEDFISECNCISDI